MIIFIENSMISKTPSIQRFLKEFGRRIDRSVHTKTPRVRFAPSPTGYLHLGGLRTALYNFLFAKSQGGTFLLRVEDTDQSRKVAGAVERLVSDLEWVGIHYDEGPKLGNYGPYTQSERLDIYRDHVTKLLANGSAYHCFCTERRLNILRRDAVKAQIIPKYDNRCRYLTADEVKIKKEAGVQHCIRFMLTPDVQQFEDLIFGGIAYDVSLNEGDPVIMKSDGYPTYHFANVVDDHLMNITHVLRGVEWQISTTKHILLYKAFNWQPPLFGHLPLIVNSDGTKLSKRQGDVTVDDYRKKGVFPLALVNYITLAGGGFDHVRGEGVSIKTIEELAGEFQLQKISPHPTRLNSDLLEECNRLELIRLLKTEATREVLITELQQLITNTYPKENLNVTREHVRNVLEWSVKRISKLQDLVSSKFAFLWILPSNYQLDETQKVLTAKLIEDLHEVKHLEEKEIKEFLKKFSKENAIKFPVLMKYLRSVLSGLEEGPGVAEMICLLGKEQCMLRLETAIR